MINSKRKPAIGSFECARLFQFHDGQFQELLTYLLGMTVPYFGALLPPTLLGAGDGEVSALFGLDWNEKN